MTQEFAIQTRGLTRYFGKKEAVCQLNLEVPCGVVFGFLGRNGSGKTTTIRMLLGLLKPTRGSASVMGEDCQNLSPETRARIGYMTEGHSLYSWMKVRECGLFQSAFYPKWKKGIFQSVVDHFHLSEDAKVKNLSRGERAGLCLALTLAPEPELLILDDPALGLDPVARRSLLESMIYLTRRSDRTIFFSSHLLSDVERVADYIAVMDRSVLRAACPLETFRERVTQRILRFKGAPPDIPPIPGLLEAFRAEGEIRLTLANCDSETEKVIQSLNADQTEETPMSLEDAFISYLGERGVRNFILSHEGDEQ